MHKLHRARFWRLVREHTHTVNAALGSLSTLPGTAKPFASTVALSRYCNHEFVTLPALIEPGQDAIRDALSRSDGPVALVAHDWSMIHYRTRNRDRYRRSHASDLGYELGTALVIETAHGRTLGPMELRLRTAHEIVSTRPTPTTCPPGHIDELGPVMDDSRRWNLGRPVVHVIDREADSVDHYRQWARRGHTFLVRADAERVVMFGGRELKVPQVIEQPGVCLAPATGAGGAAVRVRVAGVAGTVWVAEAPVVLHRPGKKRVGKGKRVDVFGEPLAVRLVVSWVLADDGEVLAEWFLFTNVAPRFDAATVAQWYAWRWRIESYHKVLKSAGMNAEKWQQKSGEAVARRLVVASTACLLVWCLQREESAEAVSVRRLLVRLSGRQMKWGVEHTTPALLAGLDKLLAVLDLLRTHDWETVVAQTRRALPNLFDST
jgi:hypothetical protein